jgi:glycosyltransferase involved in cell wall biosynthesis
MNRLLMVTTIPATVTAFLIPFAQSLRSKGWQVDGMACEIAACPDCAQIFDHCWDVDWSRNPLSLRNLFGAPQRIQSVIAQGNYDIVHVHTPVAAFVTRYALRNRAIKNRPQVIYTSHGFNFSQEGNVGKNFIFRHLEKIAGPWTDFLVTINREDERAAKAYQLTFPEQIRYMPGIGLDLQHYNPETPSLEAVENVRQELGLTSETDLVLSVAELIPRKHPQDVLKAFARLARPHVCLAFAGDGPMMQTLQQLATQLGIQQNVRFLGHRRDIPTLMCAAVVTVLASELEGLPRCVMESMGLETPVIATDIRGVRDLLDQDSDLLFKVGDLAGLSKAIAWVLDHPEEARSMGQRARARVAKHDIRHIIQLHEELYTEALLTREGKR